MINRLKASLVLIPIVFLLVVGAYVYSLWAAERRRSADIPVEGASMMMRDLLAFHEKRGSFPRDLKQLEGVIWENKRERNFSDGGRGFAHRNYFYLYTQLNPHRFTLWAIPMGDFRDEAPTWFFAATPDSYRRWKGPSLRPEDAGKISSNASPKELGILGLVEQSPLNLKKKQTVLPY
jgi:hypothetical protein